VPRGGTIAPVSRRPDVAIPYETARFALQVLALALRAEWRMPKGEPMIDREKVLTVLSRRFPDATANQLASAANAIVGLPDEWEDVSNREEEFGYHYSAQCTDLCYLAQQVERGDQFKIFRRRAVRFR
jgi:hypothetical protein